MVKRLLFLMWHVLVTIQGALVVLLLPEDPLVSPLPLYIIPNGEKNVITHTFFKNALSLCVTFLILLHIIAGLYFMTPLSLGFEHECEKSF